MLKTSLRTLLSHCSREPQGLGDFFKNLICITMARSPAFSLLSPCCLAWPVSRSGPGIPLDSSFLSPPKVSGLALRPTPAGFCLSAGGCASARRRRAGTWHIPGPPRAPAPAPGITAQAPKKQLGDSPGTGLVGPRFQWFKIPCSPLGRLSRCTDSTKASSLELESPRTAVCHGHSIAP